MSGSADVVQKKLRCTETFGIPQLRSCIRRGGAAQAFRQDEGILGSRSLGLADLSLNNTVAKESRKYNYPEKMSFHQAVEENIAAKMKKTDYI